MRTEILGQVLTIHTSSAITVVAPLAGADDDLKQAFTDIGVDLAVSGNAPDGLPADQWDYEEMGDYAVWVLHLNGGELPW